MGHLNVGYIRFKELELETSVNCSDGNIKLCLRKTSLRQLIIDERYTGKGTPENESNSLDT